MTALLGLEARLRTARLFMVTDSRPGPGDLAGFAGAACAGGVDIVQLSDATLDRRQTLAALAVLRTAARPRQSIVAVSRDARLAAEFGADMLVLDDDGSPAREARRRLHPWALVGRSCRSRAAIDAALEDPHVHFLLVTADLGSVGHAASRAPQGDPASKPWFAAGGITIDYLDSLVAAGCRRVAVSRALTRAREPRAAAGGFADALRRAWAEDPAMARVTLAAFGAPRPSPPV